MFKTFTFEENICPSVEELVDFYAALARLRLVKNFDSDSCTFYFILKKFSVKKIRFLWNILPCLC
jgi:hypothetical protein